MHLDLMHAAGMQRLADMQRDAEAERLARAVVASRSGPWRRALGRRLVKAGVRLIGPGPDELWARFAPRQGAGAG